MLTPADTDAIDAAGLARLVATGVPLPAEVEAVLPDGRDDYEISPDLARVIAGIVLPLYPRSVLEFGSRRSSLVIARALSAAGGGRLTSVENAPEFGHDAWALGGRSPRSARVSCGSWDAAPVTMALTLACSGVAIASLRRASFHFRGSRPTT